MGALPVSRFSVEEYLAGEQTAEFPSEYVDGEIFRVELATLAHSLLSARLAYLLAAKLGAGPCRPASQVSLRVSASRYLLPDLAVICDKPMTDRGVVVSGAKVIIEVLSPATEGYDRGAKFAFYRSIPAFEEYVLVSQDTPLVEVYTRQADDSWVYRAYEMIEATAHFHALGFDIPLTEIYSGIVDPPSE